MSDLSQELNKIASDKGASGKFSALLALAALVLLDKNNNVIFDADDLAGTVSRLRAAGSLYDVVDIELAPENSGDPYNVAGHAAIIVNPTAPNSAFVLTAIAAGAVGNDLTVHLIDPGAINIPLSVAIKGGGRSIEITLATDGAGVITTTSGDIITLLAGSTLVTAANAAANDGTGLVNALETMTDGGGYDVTGIGVAGKGSRYTDTTNGALWINQGTKAAPNWVKLATV